MNLLPAFLVFFLANLRCEFAIRYRYPYFKFELEDEYMELFRYSNLPTEGKTFTIICYNDLDWGSCMYHHAFSAYTFPCPEYCEVRGNDTYCKIEPSGGKPIFCRSEYIHYMAFSYYLDDSNGSCVSCDATNSSKLMFTYKNFIRFRQFESAPCNSLTECADTHFYEDVHPVDYYEDGDFHRTSHCDILSKDIVEIPSVLIFSDANIAPGIPFQIYLVDEINEKKRLLRYFEFVELPVGGTLYFEINSVELVTCYLYTDDSFIGFFAVSALNPTISLEEIRHNYGICEFEMLCEGRLNAFHSSIVAYTRQTFVILESPVMWEYASSKPLRRYWKLLSLLKCDDVLFQVLRWDTQNIVVTLQIWDLTEGRMLSNDTFGNRVTFRRGNNQYAVKVKAIYDRCNPRVLIERDIEVRFTFKKCPGDISILSDDYRLEGVHN
ncbi:Chromosomal serine/threonine-protein kinase [Trichinella spiralis]|uniref:Chromosomal serine/threonine-protein kinase n=1 Tax=Trichinella spiralis TaxID=6334 RepID=A0ABR3KVS4_TRISP